MGLKLEAWSLKLQCSQSPAVGLCADTASGRLRHPWPLNENVPVFDTLSRIYTGSCYLFDLASFGTNVKLTANLVLPQSWLDYDLRPLTSWCFAHTRPRGNQRLFPLGTPSRPATFSLFTKQQQRKGRNGDWSSFWPHLTSASALFENANASDGTSCTAKASGPSMASSRILL